ncbi:hypothetical protein [Streptomyces griseorubiginosus]|uniref:hypothetical protein n=1 Tax=Streptomyces griseorubiginosus TaxID=67304 RepID=UPI001AD6535A|nr:hypothetical protein [Streptomyces griseorubiginosus]MBO4256375.1 hypothetical protein [Streptomyces griseorubiginosus]
MSGTLGYPSVSVRAIAVGHEFSPRHPVDWPRTPAVRAACGRGRTDGPTEDSG